jgi:hypothetical protein
VGVLKTHKIQYRAVLLLGPHHLPRIAGAPVCAKTPSTPLFRGAGHHIVLLPVSEGLVFFRELDLLPSTSPGGRAVGGQITNRLEYLNRVSAGHHPQPVAIAMRREPADFMLATSVGFGAGGSMYILSMSRALASTPGCRAADWRAVPLQQLSNTVISVEHEDKIMRSDRYRPEAGFKGVSCTCGALTPKC